MSTDVLRYLQTCQDPSRPHLGSEVRCCRCWPDNMPLSQSVILGTPMVAHGELTDCMGGETERNHIFSSHLRADQARVSTAVLKRYKNENAADKAKHALHGQQGIESAP